MNFEEEQELKQLLKVSLRKVEYVTLWQMKDRLYELSKVAATENLHGLIKKIAKRIKAIDKKINKEFSKEGNREYLKQRSEEK